MKDIAPELLERIEKDFERVFSSDSTIKALYRKTKNGTATYEDAQKFAVRTGELLADTFRNNLSSEILPDGRLYYNIASRILNSTLSNNHSLISGYAADVQYFANSKAGVGIKVQPAQLDQERIDGIVNIVSGKYRYDDIAYMLDEPVITFGQAVVDDSLKRNVNFQGKFGLSPRVVRRATGNPCPWCEAVAGSYTYPDVPHDVYRRHKRCRCIVEYEPGDGRRQNVHSKEWTDAAELEKRKSIGLETPLKKEPGELKRKVEPKRLMQNSEIVKRHMTNELAKLNADDKKILREYSGNLAYQLNRRLVTGNLNDYYTDKARRLSKALEKCVITDDMVVIRQIASSDIGISKENMWLYQNKGIPNKNFLSTSMEPFDYKGRDVIINIKVRKGYRGAAYIKSFVSPRHRIQEEVLFKRGTVYRITSAVFKDGKIYLEAEMVEK